MRRLSLLSSPAFYRYNHMHIPIHRGLKMLKQKGRLLCQIEHIDLVLDGVSHVLHLSENEL